MLTVKAADLDRLFDFPALVETLRAAFRKGAVQPERHHHSILHEGGAPTTLLLMPAWTEPGAAGPCYAGIKIVTVAPDNNLVGKPAVMATYLLLDGRTGEPLAKIDGQRLTLWRTAAASALAASYLARRDASRLLVVGAGALAPFLARAHAAVRPIREIRVWNRTEAAAERVAEDLRSQGLPAAAVPDLDAAVAWADIVSAATLSERPLVRGALLGRGAHLDLVGAFTPAMRESDDEAVRRARIFVDTRAGALKEGGDLAQPLAAGLIGPEDIAADLFDLAQGAHPGRTGADEITLFKSVGAALEDLAAAASVFERLSGGESRT